MMYEISRSIAKVIAKFCFRVRIVGREHIPQAGPCLLVANHASFLDPFVICTSVPRTIHYITYAFFYYHPAFHWFCKRVHCIPVKKEGNDISALKQTLRLLKQGEIVGIFPEGARSENGKIGRTEPGTALIALKSNVPIVPAGIQGAYEAFPKGAKFPKPGRITVSFGRPFFLTEYIRNAEKMSTELQQEAMQVIMGKIAELCGQQDAFSSEQPFNVLKEIS
ncbi:phospholipid/glycerol acyltransferase [Candidatus Vecturithrix granuli]|uniref:Phospholipid/glycerol acyltransferase n=1 Tax=Vecturithrix granuli TaxID=1499967 RepID=A0A081BVP0_VECG1|nr:phospholipid/glycerol acyltransferase [Candidatus Vecturithrix granuli]